MEVLFKNALESIAATFMVNEFSVMVCGIMTIPDAPEEPLIAALLTSMIRYCKLLGVVNDNGTFDTLVFDKMVELPVAKADMELVYNLYRDVQFVNGSPNALFNTTPLFKYTFVKFVQL